MLCKDESKVYVMSEMSVNKRSVSQEIDKKGICLFAIITIVLVYGTGIVSDDITEIAVRQGMHDFWGHIVPRGNFVNLPVAYLTHMWVFSLIDIDNLLLVDIIKAVHAILSLYMVAKFFSLFLDGHSALLTSFLFLFFPIRDSITYWYMGTHMAFSMCCYLFAYYLVHKDYLQRAATVAFLASFMSYGSPPTAFALFILCVLKKNFKKGLFLFVPNIVYCIYYIYLKGILFNGPIKSNLPPEINLLTIAKQLLLQIVTFFDALAGPSFFLKIYYSIIENNIWSIIAIIIFVSLYLKMVSNKKICPHQIKLDKSLLAALTVLVIGSLVMFSITGRYPQLAFNLGNRTTIYGALLLSYLIAAVPINQYLRQGILLLIFVSIVGVSVHWKIWNNHQIEVFHNIQTNEDLQNYDKQEPVFVIGNQYSKMGPFSHIEFLSENWVANSLFELAEHNEIKALALNKRFIVKENLLVDQKHQNIITIGPVVNIYDSEADKLMTVTSDMLNQYISNLSDEKRHWVQMINNEKIDDAILKLMPRLKYAF
jgi:hypothetical protein